MWFPKLPHIFQVSASTYGLHQSIMGPCASLLLPSTDSTCPGGRTYFPGWPTEKLNLNQRSSAFLGSSLWVLSRLRSLFYAFARRMSALSKRGYSPCYTARRNILMDPIITKKSPFIVGTGTPTGIKIHGLGYRLDY